MYLKGRDYWLAFKQFLCRWLKLNSAKKTCLFLSRRYSMPNKHWSPNSYHRYLASFCLRRAFGESITAYQLLRGMDWSLQVAGSWLNANQKYVTHTDLYFFWNQLKSKSDTLQNGQGNNLSSPFLDSFYLQNSFNHHDRVCFWECWKQSRQWDDYKSNGHRTIWIRIKLRTAVSLDADFQSIDIQETNYAAAITYKVANSVNSLTNFEQYKLLLPTFQLN